MSRFGAWRHSARLANDGQDMALLTAKCFHPPWTALSGHLHTWRPTKTLRRPRHRQSFARFLVRPPILAHGGRIRRNSWPEASRERGYRARLAGFSRGLSCRSAVPLLLKHMYTASRDETEAHKRGAALLLKVMLSNPDAKVHPCDKRSTDRPCC